MTYCNTVHNTSKLQSIYLICCIYLRSIHMITSNHWSLWISDDVSWVSCTCTPQTHRVRSVIPPGQSGPSLTERCRRDADTRCSPKKRLMLYCYTVLLCFTTQFLTVNVGAIISWKTVELDDHSLQNPLRLNLHCLVALLKETTLSVRERLTYYRRTANSPLAEPRSWSWETDWG